MQTARGPAAGINQKYNNFNEYRALGEINFNKYKCICLHAISSYNNSITSKYVFWCVVIVTYAPLLAYQCPLAPMQDGRSKMSVVGAGRHGCDCLWDSVYKAGGETLKKALALGQHIECAT